MLRPSPPFSTDGINDAVTALWHSLGANGERNKYRGPDLVESFIARLNTEIDAFNSTSRAFKDRADTNKATPDDKAIAAATAKIAKALKPVAVTLAKIEKSVPHKNWWKSPG